jgi:hypothetical protein
MMSLDVLVILFALTLFFWRAAADFDRATSQHSSPPANPATQAGKPSVATRVPGREASEARLRDAKPRWAGDGRPR